MLRGFFGEGWGDWPTDAKPMKVEEEGPEGYRTEFHYGSLRRSMRLPEGAHADDITATYSDPHHPQLSRYRDEGPPGAGPRPFSRSLDPRGCRLLPGDQGPPHDHGVRA